MVSVNAAQTRRVGNSVLFCPPSVPATQYGLLGNGGPKPTLQSTPVPATLHDTYRAWQRARRGKKPSANQLVFASRWADRLHTLTSTLRAGAWQPARTVSFVVTHPKTREIHAPDFADRVAHHWLVPQLETLYEPIFIHHSYANRKGKGSHGAVDALQGMMRSAVGRVPTRHGGMEQTVVSCVDGGFEPALREHTSTAHYLQLDIHNFFNSIHRPTLFAMLSKRLDKAQRNDTPVGRVPTRHGGVEQTMVSCPDGGRQLNNLPALRDRITALRSLCHKLLAVPTTSHTRNPAAAALVPPHKRLANAACDCGLPVGNLTSQFFANVYLNALDQFVKHTLKVRHYVRYVDDFVLLSHSKLQLQAWKAQIEAFLANTLRLRLKQGSVLQACSQGIDFLGYRVFAHHRWVRPRVLRHARSKIAAWWQQHRRFHVRNAVSYAQFAKLQALLGSYWGHFAHANSVRLRHHFFTRFPWLHDYFDIAPDGSIAPNAPARWAVRRRQAARRAGSNPPSWHETNGVSMPTWRV
jgi:RNA-directed DNA polymerase